MGYKKRLLSRGFTIVEILIVAPIVILVIGVFITAIVNMTGDVLATRASNVLSYNIQDALNRIEQDVDSSSGYLAANNITLTSPQGYNDDAITSFKNVAANGTMLILNTYATTSNPLNSTSIVYTPSPNLCGSNLVSQNPPVMMNIIYFVKNGTLWRRVVAPSNYATIGCSVPWQQPSCMAGTSGGSFCKAQDTRLVDDIVPSTGFNVGYYTSASSATANSTASDSGQADSARQTALRLTNTASVTINAADTIAGRDISQSGTIRAVSPNTGDPNWLAIGTQTWAKANLNVGTMVTGVTAQTNNSTLEKYCYLDTESNCTANGAFYQWDEAMQYVTTNGAQGICPAGSHIPTDNDWKILEVQLGMTQAQADATSWRGTDQGTQLKPGGSSGLNMPLAGYRYPDGSFIILSSYAALWSSSESSTSAWDRALYSGHATVSRSTYDKAHGLSVRCLGN